MAREKCPCRGCSDRVLGCHGVCKDYIEWANTEKEIAKWERDSRPPTINRSSFLGTSPKPGKKRKPRRT